MLHIHFGTGRLGLGLIGPAFRKPDSELFLLNRAVSGDKATGSTSLDAARRNELLATGNKRYCIERPGGSVADRTVVSFDDSMTYDGDTLTQRIEEIADRSRQAGAGVVVTASILAPETIRR